MPVTKKNKKKTTTQRTKRSGKAQKANVIVLPADKCDQPVPKGTVVLRRFPSTTGRAGRPKNQPSMFF